MKCPLCKSKQILSIENIDIDIIKEHYIETNLDISYLFNTTSLEYLECKNCNLKFFRPIVEGDDKYYSHLQKDDWYFLHEDKTEFEFSKKYINSNDKVLDVGSGRGAFKKYIDCSLYQGLELSHKAIELAQKDGVNVINETVQKHVKGNFEKYDVVALFQVLEHISDIDNFIQSSLNCLKRNGYFIVAVPNNDSFLKNATNNFLNLPPHHQNHFTQKSLKQLATIYNLEIIEEFKEKVTNVHKEWFYQILKEQLVYKCLKKQHKLCETTLPRIHGINKKIINIIIFIAKLLKYHKKQDGHSIIFVYKKK